MKFQWPKSQCEMRDITRRQLEWLLEGLQIDQKKAHPDNIDTSGMIF
jgi:transposase